MQPAIFLKFNVHNPVVKCNTSKDLHTLSTGVRYIRTSISA